MARERREGQRGRSKGDSASLSLSLSLLLLSQSVALVLLLTLACSFQSNDVSRIRRGLRERRGRRRKRRNSLSGERSWRNAVPRKKVLPLTRLCLCLCLCGCGCAARPRMRRFCVCSVRPGCSEEASQGCEAGRAGTVGNHGRSLYRRRKTSLSVFSPPRIHCHYYLLPGYSCFEYDCVQELANIAAYVSPAASAVYPYPSQCTSLSLSLFISSRCISC